MVDLTYLTYILVAVAAFVVTVLLWLLYMGMFKYLIELNLLYPERSISMSEKFLKWQFCNVFLVFIRIGISTILGPWRILARVQHIWRRKLRNYFLESRSFLEWEASITQHLVLLRFLVLLLYIYNAKRIMSGVVSSCWTMFLKCWKLQGNFPNRLSTQ